jgi:heme/copper-type cytochrome/quinol oxidase subunit 3
MAEASVRGAERELIIGELGYGSIDRRASGWWGMLTVILSESFLFAYLLFSYYYFAVQYGHAWLPRDLPSFWLSGPNTVVLLASSVAVWAGERGARRGLQSQLLLGLAIAIVLGVASLCIQLLELSNQPFGLASHPYGSMFFMVTGFHMAHVAAGVLMLAALLLWSVLGYFDRERLAPVTIGAIYWYFVNAAWLAVFFTFYITPYLS